MISCFAVSVGLVLQAAGNPHAARPTHAPEPVRFWRADSTIYVQLREPGHLVLLQAGPIGRIRVLFPLAPDDSTSISGDAPVAIPLPPDAQGNPSTLVAIRSRWPFEFTALRAKGEATWNYHDAWLLQPTAGDPLTALLDIADRITDGRPYDYGAVRYSKDGSVATLGPPLQPQVCLSCVRRGTAVAAVPTPAAIQTNSVDCSNASLTNSFCGVANNIVSITSVLPTPPAQVVYQAAPMYVPYFLPIAVHRDRSRFPPPPTRGPSLTPPSAAAAFPIAPRLVVPSGSELRTYGGRRP